MNYKGLELTTGGKFLYLDGKLVVLPEADNIASDLGFDCAESLVKFLSEKSCLTCKYEPEWSEWRGSDKYRWCSGRCNYPLDLPPLPGVYRVVEKTIKRHSDNSGARFKCKTWKSVDAETKCVNAVCTSNAPKVIDGCGDEDYHRRVQDCVNMVYRRTEL